MKNSHWILVVPFAFLASFASAESRVHIFRDTDEGTEGMELVCLDATATCHVTRSGGTESTKEISRKEADAIFDGVVKDLKKIPEQASGKVRSSRALHLDFVHGETKRREAVPYGNKKSRALTLAIMKLEAKLAGYLK